MLVLPLHNRVEDKALKAPSSRTANKSSHKDVAGQMNVPIRVLLVDDHTMMRQGLRSIVTAYDHLEVVGEAGDGVEAVELAQQLDPGGRHGHQYAKDGWDQSDAADQSPSAGHRRYRPVGESIGRYGTKMKAAGAAAYLTKESAVDALCHAIEQAVSYKQHPATRPDSQ